MERRILEVFAARYPASAQRRGGRPMRVKAWEELLPDAFATGAARLSFLDAMERLERAGILRLEWKKRLKGDALLAAELVGPGALYRRLGLPTPEAEAAELRSAALGFSSEALSRGDGAAAALFSRIAEKTDSLAGRLTPRDAADAAALFAFDREEAARLQIRALSIRLFRDSKRLEALAALLRPLADSPSTLPVRSYPEAAVAGSVEFAFSDGAVWPLAGRPVALSLEAAEALRAIRAAKAGRPRALSVENKETFHAFARHPLGFDFTLCAGGRPNRAVRAVLRTLAASGFEVFHAGDMDADGISILAEVASVCGARPFGMDPETFDRYAPFARELDATLVARTASIPEEALKIPGIAELVARIRETGKGVEQEIIDYGSLTPPPRCPS